MLALSISFLKKDSKNYISAGNRKNVCYQKLYILRKADSRNYIFFGFCYQKLYHEQIRVMRMLSLIISFKGKCYQILYILGILIAFPISFGTFCEKYGGFRGHATNQTAKIFFCWHFVTQNAYLAKPQRRGFRTPREM